MLISVYQYFSGCAACRQSSANLVKACRQNKDFSLKSFLRFRATHSPVALIGSGRSSYYECTMTLEALSPNISFQYAPINPLPLRSVPAICKAEPCSNVALRMGYVTLDETRKIVPLDANDSTFSTVPCVGIWIYVNEDMQTFSCHTLLSHPFVHGSCVRFLEFAGIAERVMHNDNCFLMVSVYI
jgi:hypothetical protein